MRHSTRSQAKTLFSIFALSAGVLAACADPDEPDGSTPAADSGVDGGNVVADGGSSDAGSTDLGTTADAGTPDGGASDTGVTTDAAVGDGGIQHATCDAPIQVDNALRLSPYPRISSTRAGQIGIAWQEIDTQGSTARGVVRLYENGGFVGPPHILGENVSFTAEVAFDGVGNAHVRWGDYPALRVRAEYTQSSNSWGPTQTALADLGSDLTNVQSAFAINTAGDAIQVFWWNESTLNTVGAASYDPGTDMWSTITTLFQEPAGGAGYPSPNLPEVAINEAGQGVVVFTTLDSNVGDTTLHAVGFAGGVWGTPVGVTVTAASMLYRPVMGANGQALVVYTGLYKMLARAFDPAATAGSEWGAEQIIEDMANTIGQPVVLQDDDGNVTALWPSSETLRFSRNFGSGWTPSGLVGPTQSPISAALDKDGNVSVVTQRGGEPMYLRRMAKLGDTWTAPVDVSEGDTGFSGPPLLAHDELGNPVVAYTNIRTSTTGGGNIGHVHWRVCR